MTVLLLALLAFWASGGIVLLALCRMAARGDRQPKQHVVAPLLVSPLETTVPASWTAVGTGVHGARTGAPA